MFLPTFLLIAGSVVMVTSMSCTVGNEMHSDGDRILQVCMDGMNFMDVCFSGWSEDEAEVRCRNRNRPGAKTNWQESTLSSTATALNISCLGTEVNLGQCNYTIAQESCNRVVRSFCFRCPDLACPDTGTCINERYCGCKNPCENNGDCHAGVCYCPDGFTGDNCENITCPLGCDNGGMCLSNGTCQCSYPFHGTNCEMKMCPAECENKGTCLSNGTCQCSYPFHGTNCEIKMCPAECENKGTCLSNGTCQCSYPYHGTYCEMEMCPAECENKGTCLSNGTCQCSYPYHGTYCEMEMCPAECENKGTCLSNGTCQCSYPYHGTYCEMEMCSAECENKGTCLSNGTCQCSYPYHGTYCEMEMCPAECENKGTCLSNGTCQCSYPYHGTYCEMKMCPAECENGGMCFPDGTCQCIVPYYGISCQTEACIPKCTQNKDCVKGMCVCNDSHFGANCMSIKCTETCLEHQYCAPNSVCQCKSGWSGINCEDFSQPISSQPNVNQMTSPTTINTTTTSTEHPVIGAVTSPIIYSVPVVIILIVIVLIIVVIIFLLFCLRRNRKSKSTSIRQFPEELYSEVHLHTMTQPQSESCVYEDMYQSVTVEPNPYMESNLVNPTYSVGEEILVPPPYEKIKFSVEKEVYGQLGLSVLENDIYQTYENCCQLPFAGSSTVVPRYDSQEEIAYEIPKDLQSEQNPESYFEQEDIYWEPRNNLGLLFNQMADKNFREIAESAITRQEQIGSGQFGNVYKGLWYTSGNEPNPFLASEPISVALKTLHNCSTLDLKTTFIQEAAIMGQFSHPNVLRLLGIVSRTEPYMIVTELMHTELLKFLISIRDSTLQHSVMCSLFLNLSRQIAAGMTYLSSKHFIHRDLAARNVLIAKDLTCRIADFGLSRQLRDEGDYYTSKGGKIPLKWSSPEAIFYKRYSEKSDVWSFGMTLYEIWSIGEKPWTGYSNEDVLLALSKLEVLNRPYTCPQGVFSVMLECWTHNQDLRPSFLQVSHMLADSENSLLDTAP